MNKSDVTFITGNQNKADYLAKMLGVSVEHQKVDLDEIQSYHAEEIVTHKVRQAYGIVGKPVIVEDVSLGFTALGGLPGPFIKFFIEQTDGLAITCKMIDGFDDRSAQASCTFGYFDGAHLKIFKGSLSGTVAKKPRGQDGYGWDAIFCPDGFDGRTSAELSSVEYQDFYTKIKPFAALREFLQTIVT